MWKTNMEQCTTVIVCAHFYNRDRELKRNLVKQLVTVTQLNSLIWEDTEETEAQAPQSNKKEVGGESNYSPTNDNHDSETLSHDETMYWRNGAETFIKGNDNSVIDRTVSFNNLKHLRLLCELNREVARETCIQFPGSSGFAAHKQIGIDWLRNSCENARQIFDAQSRPVTEELRRLVFLICYDLLSLFELENDSANTRFSCRSAISSNSGRNQQLKHSALDSLSSRIVPLLLKSSKLFMFSDSPLLDCRPQLLGKYYSWLSRFLLTTASTDPNLLLGPMERMTLLLQAARVELNLSASIPLFSWTTSPLHGSKDQHKIHILQRDEDEELRKFLNQNTENADEKEKRMQFEDAIIRLVQETLGVRCYRYGSNLTEFTDKESDIDLGVDVNECEKSGKLAIFLNSSHYHCNSPPYHHSPSPQSLSTYSLAPTPESMHTYNSVNSCSHTYTTPTSKHSLSPAAIFNSFSHISCPSLNHSSSSYDEANSIEAMNGIHSENVTNGNNSNNHACASLTGATVRKSIPSSLSLPSLLACIFSQRLEDCLEFKNKIFGQEPRPLAKKPMSISPPVLPNIQMPKPSSFSDYPNDFSNRKRSQSFQVTGKSDDSFILSSFDDEKLCEDYTVFERAQATEANATSPRRLPWASWTSKNSMTIKQLFKAFFRFMAIEFPSGGFIISPRVGPCLMSKISMFIANNAINTQLINFRTGIAEQHSKKRRRRTRTKVLNTTSIATKSKTVNNGLNSAENHSNKMALKCSIPEQCDKICELDTTIDSNDSAAFTDPDSDLLSVDNVHVPLHHTSMELWISKHPDHTIQTYVQSKSEESFNAFDKIMIEDPCENERLLQPTRAHVSDMAKLYPRHLGEYVGYMPAACLCHRAWWFLEAGLSVYDLMKDLVPRRTSIDDPGPVDFCHMGKLDWYRETFNGKNPSAADVIKEVRSSIWIQFLTRFGDKFITNHTATTAVSSCHCSKLINYYVCHGAWVKQWAQLLNDIEEDFIQRNLVLRRDRSAAGAAWIRHQSKW